MLTALRPPWLMLYVNGVATALVVAVDTVPAMANNNPNQSAWHSNIADAVVVEKGDLVTLKWERASVSRDDNLWMTVVEFSED